MSNRPICILLDDHAVTYRTFVSDVLAEVPGVEVVDATPNENIAPWRAEDLHPDLSERPGDCPSACSTCAPQYIDVFTESEGRA